MFVIKLNTIMINFTIHHANIEFQECKTIRYQLDKIVFN